MKKRIARKILKAYRDAPCVVTTRAHRRAPWRIEIPGRGYNMRTFGRVERMLPL